MIQLAIDTRQNRVTVEDSGATCIEHYQFRRRWEAMFLARLVQEKMAMKALTFADLCFALQQRGQSVELNRAQVLRLLHSLQGFFDAFPRCGLGIDAPPRKATVGPWTLRSHAHVTYLIDDGQTDFDTWLHPALTRVPLNTEPLCHFLGVLLTADALALEGRFDPAIQVLIAEATDELSPEAQGLVALRLCNWYKQQGRFAAARAQAQAVLLRPTGADPGLHHHARFMLQRIDYDETPVGKWLPLWHTTHQPPGAGGADSAFHPGNWCTLADWHNLRALLARRYLHAVRERRAPHANPTGAEPSVPVLHLQALKHLEAALYMALWFKDWGRVQAYVANLAFHLQALTAKNDPLHVPVSTVLQWHRLFMAYESKLDAGRDSAWEYIFFAEFWLNHAKAAAQPDPASPPRPDTVAHLLSSATPDQEAYYQHALEQLRQRGDDRQVAIGHSLYLRFAQQHMRGKARQAAVAQQTEQLLALLMRQTHSQLLAALRQEGYEAAWPEALRLALRGKSRCETSDTT